MSPRIRLVAFLAVVILAVGGSIGYLVGSRAEQQDAVRHATPVEQASAEAIQDAAHIVFRNTALGPDYGKVAMVAIEDPDGARAVTTVTCDRVYVAAGRTLCLFADRGLVTTHRADVLDRDLSVTHELPLTGVPSRARLSPDGSMAATTSFVAGDSYATGNFSTRTVISRIDGDDRLDLETFTLVHDGREIAPVDRNYWGVTFAADGDTFYATVSWDGRTWLVEGSVDDRLLTTLHADAECPSLSPDGSTVVYKKRGAGPPGTWRLAGLDLGTGVETMLAETRTVDDQVEWLDAKHVIYGIPRSGSAAATSDVFVVPADGSGAPDLLIPQAWSPAVVR